MLLVWDDLARLHHVGVGSLARCHHGVGNLLAGLLVVDRLGRNGLDHHHARLLSGVLRLRIVDSASGNLLVVVAGVLIGVGVALARVLEVLWLDEGNVEDQADANEYWHDPW